METRSSTKAFKILSSFKNVTHKRTGGTSIVVIKIVKRTELLVGFLAVCLNISFSACRKDLSDPIPRLPSATAIGKNVLGCYVDGKLQVYEGLSNYNRPWGASFSYSDTPDYYALLRASGKKSEALMRGDIRLAMYTAVLKEDTAYQDFSGANSFSEYVQDGVETKNYFHVQSNDTFNFIKFTRIDDAVAAGTFQFRGYSSITGDSVYVTEGRFDIAR